MHVNPQRRISAKLAQATPAKPSTSEDKNNQAASANPQPPLPQQQQAAGALGQGQGGQSILGEGPGKPGAAVDAKQGPISAIEPEGIVLEQKEPGPPKQDALKPSSTHDDNEKGISEAKFSPVQRTKTPRRQQNGKKGSACCGCTIF